MISTYILMWSCFELQRRKANGVYLRHEQQGVHNSISHYGWDSWEPTQDTEKRCPHTSYSPGPCSRFGLLTFVKNVVIKTVGILVVWSEFICLKVCLLQYCKISYLLIGINLLAKRSIFIKISLKSCCCCFFFFTAVLQFGT